MRRCPIREVEQKERVRPGLLLAGLAVFAAVAVLLWGDVKTYEFRQENAGLEQTLADFQEERARLLVETAGAPDLHARAQTLGLRKPEANQTVILHLRTG